MSDASKTKPELLAELRALRGEVARLVGGAAAATAGAALGDDLWGDPSAWKSARDALRASEHRLVTLAENATDLIAEVDSEGRFLYVSPNCKAILGRSPEETIGSTLNEIIGAGHVHSEDSTRLAEGFQRNVAAGDGGEIEFRFRHADGTWHWFESKGRTYRLSDGSLRAVVISRDVTERHRTRAELAESQERYRLLAHGSRDAIWEMDAEGRLVYASPAVQDLIGYRPEEITGTTPFHLVHADEIEAVVESFLRSIARRRRVSAGSYRMRHRDGSWRWVEGWGVTYLRADGETRFLCVTRDISERVAAEEERRALERQMQQAQKLEGLGVMAGGIAHDFNNLLTPILGDASLALMDLPGDAPVRAALQRIQRAAQRAAALTNQMLAYAGTGPLLLEPVDLSKLVREMAQLLESAISSEAVLVYRLESGLPAVEADATQLSQVVMNLITNAAEAVGDGPGRIVVQTSRVEIDGGASRSVIGEAIPPGPYVFAEVADDGCGMDEDTRGRIFDPFFTTKFTGRGLGLAAVLGIVRGHRGAIEVESAPLRGTRVRVLLPSAGGRALPAPRGSGEEVPWQGEGAVLVIDDDEGVRELAAATLRRSGLTPLTAADCGEAVEQLRARRDTVRAVLLDRTMPGIGGAETLEALRRVCPDVPVVLMSGYSEERAAEDLGLRDLAGFLQKPFLPSTLVSALRRVLDGAD